MGQQKTKIIGMEELGAVSVEQMKKVGRKRVKQDKQDKQEEQDHKGQMIEQVPTAVGTVEQASAIEQPKRPKVGRARVRSQKYKQVVALVDRKKQYGLDEAIELVKKTAYAKFDATVEIHIKTVAKKGQDPIRVLVALPSGAVKAPKVAVASDELLQEIEKGKIDFDILLATPAMMPKLAKVAKILGPKGLMPSPKSGTIVEDPQKAIAEIGKGRVEIRQDPLGNVHVAVGKVSWPTEKLKANIQSILSAIQSNRIDRISLSATMGPGIKVSKV